MDVTVEAVRRHGAALSELARREAVHQRPEEFGRFAIVGQQLAIPLMRGGVRIDDRRRLRDGLGRLEEVGRDAGAGRRRRRRRRGS